MPLTLCSKPVSLVSRLCSKKHVKDPAKSAINLLGVSRTTTTEKSSFGKSNLNDIFKRVRDGVSLIRLVLMKNVPELLTEQLSFLRNHLFFTSKV